MGQPQGYAFVMVNNQEHGYFIWEGKTIPDQFKEADGHVYEVLWDDERVQFDLVEETGRLRFLRQQIWPIHQYVMTSGDRGFYTVRNKIRGIGREASRTSFEQFFMALDGFSRFSVGD